MSSVDEDLLKSNSFTDWFLSHKSLSPNFSNKFDYILKWFDLKSTAYIIWGLKIIWIWGDGWNDQIYMILSPLNLWRHNDRRMKISFPERAFFTDLKNRKKIFWPILDLRQSEIQRAKWPLYDP